MVRVVASWGRLHILGGILSIHDLQKRLLHGFVSNSQLRLNRLGWEYLHPTLLRMSLLAPLGKVKFRSIFSVRSSLVYFQIERKLVKTARLDPCTNQLWPVIKAARTSRLLFAGAQEAQHGFTSWSISIFFSFRSLFGQ